MITPINIHKKVLKLDLDKANPSQEYNIELSYLLTQRLQTTLDPEKIITIFYDCLQNAITIDSIAYQHLKQKLQIKVNDSQKHRVSYNIAIGQQDLGELTFTRKRKFSEQEIITIENALVSLIYPIKNALLHQQTLLYALCDPLTGVGNRKALNDAMHKDIEFAKRHNLPLSVLIVDIDKFKSINDTYGHSAGDYILKRIANIISNCMRCSDKIFRFGGEEFVAILSKMDKNGAMLLANRMRELIYNTTHYYQQSEICATVSIGMAALSQQDSKDTFFERADKALYYAKSQGRNQVSIEH